MALLSAPFMTEAGSKNSSLVQVSDVSSTIAGLSTEIEVHGNTYEPVEIAVTKPNKTQLILEGITNANGYTELTLADYHVRTAGLYIVEARHLSKNEGYGPSQTFEVYPGSVSDTKSEVDLNKTTANPGETIEMTVSLQDQYGNPIDGHVLKVASSKSSVSAYSPSFATDEDGEMNFYITGEERGIADLTIFDTSVNKTLTASPKIAFLGESNSLDQGGWTDSFSSIILASETGPIDSFTIDLDSEAEVGESLSATVTAIDEDGFTVSDYTGTVRFSSSDESATLPNDYTFLAEDLGEHAFSLSVKFVTPGTQTLTVTDIDQYTIEGEAEIEVTDEDAEYDDDFETEDYDRDGDFTLISPATGSYSSDSVEVQGEADYGYFAIVYINEEEAGRVEVEYDNSFSYTLEDMEDGEYVIYVDVVDLNDSEDYEEAEILETIESSDSETIEIDTTAPEIVSISSDPEDEASVEEVVTVTVLSEAALEEAYLLFEEEIYELEETSTSAKYQTELPMPAEEGEYTIDVVLMDALGNEAQYRDQMSLTVVAATETADDDDDDDNDDDNDTTEEDDKTEETSVGQVTGLVVTEDEEAVILSWEAAEADNTVAYYRISYGPAEDALYAISDTFDSSTSWMITELSGEQTYYFAVSAIDVEGNEGEQSEVASAITLAKEGTTITEADDVPTGEEDPAISDSETPSETPDSGPGTTLLILLSILLSAGYLGVRRAHA